MPGQPFISVIVPFKQAAVYAEGFMAAVGALDYPSDRFEVLLVDDGSTDGSAEYLRAQPGVRCLKGGGLGAYDARNAGVAHAAGELLAFTDIDCLLAPDWLLSISLALAEPSTAVVLGAVNLASDSRWLHALEAYENAKAAWVCKQDDPSYYFGYTNNMAVTRSWFDRVGPFESARRGGDTILVQRICRQAGPDAVVHEPRMRVMHVEVRTVGDWVSKRFVYGRSSSRYRKVVAARPLDTRSRVAIRRELRRALAFDPLSNVIVDGLLALGLCSFVTGTLSGESVGARASPRAGDAS